jgi:hypothetical protein
MGIEAAYQFLALGWSSADRFVPSTLAKQAENLGQTAGGGAKIPILAALNTVPVPRQRGFIRICDAQPMLAKPSPKLLGDAHVPPDRLGRVLFVVEGFGENGQLVSQWSRLQSGKRGRLLE